MRDSLLIGRARELALLEQHLAGEGPPVLLFAGEPGIGKSRLLHEARAWAVRHGWQVLAGGCQRGGGHDPYAPLTGALEQRLRHIAAAQTRTELAGCAWLARLLPEDPDLPGRQRRVPRPFDVRLQGGGENDHDHEPAGTAD